MTYTIKQNDTRPVYAVQLFDKFGTPGQVPLDLTTATAVKLKMRTKGSTGTPKVNAAMTITNAVQGKAEYTWQGTDLNTVGTYDAEIEISWPGGGVETVPNEGYLAIEVVDDLDSP